MNTFLIDTNTLVYGYNKSVEFHATALEIIEDALNMRINAIIADKNLYEFYAIITDSRRVEHPVSVDKAIELIDFLVNFRSLYCYLNRNCLTALNFLLEIGYSVSFVRTTWIVL